MKKLQLFVFIFFIPFLILAIYVYWDRNRDFNLKIIFEKPELTVGGADCMKVDLFLMDDSAKQVERSIKCLMVLKEEEGVEKKIDLSVFNGKAKLDLCSSDIAGELKINITCGDKNLETSLEQIADTPVKLAIEDNLEPNVFVRVKANVNIWVVDRFGNISTDLDENFIRILPSGGCTLSSQYLKAMNGGVEVEVTNSQNRDSCAIKAMMNGINSVSALIQFNIRKTDTADKKKIAQVERAPIPSFIKGADQKNNDEFLLKIKSAIDKKNFSKAYEELIKRYEEYKTQNDYLLLLAISEYETGKYDQALLHLEILEKLGDSNRNGLYYHGETLLKINMQNSDQALAYFKRVLEAGVDDNLSRLCKNRINKINYDKEIGETFESNYFIITYNKEHGSTFLKSDFRSQIVSFSENALSQLVKEFGFTLLDKIQIVLYSKEEYEKFSTLFHFRSAGFFDGSKIRVNNSLDFNLDNKKTLFHELTHAFMDKMLAKKWVPLWMNEGLAERFEKLPEGKPGFTGDEKYILKRVQQRRGQIPMQELNLSLKNISKENIPLAYLQSFAYIIFLEEKYSFESINRLLREFKNSVTLETAFKNVLFKTQAEFEEEFWEYVRNFQ